jgi:hypothetical protein
VDEEDYALVSSHKWHPKRDRHTFYAATAIREADGKERIYRMHQIVMGAKKGQLIDHINGNGLDNRRSMNLRFCTESQNGANQGMHSRNTSGFRGVSADKRHGTWRAYITVNCRRVHIGTFGTPEDAARAYDAKACESYGRFAHLNFPLERAMLLPLDSQEKRYDGQMRFRGVHHRSNGTWSAQIRHEGKIVYLGTFATGVEAARIYDGKAREIHGDRARCNFPIE